MKKDTLTMDTAATTITTGVAEIKDRLNEVAIIDGRTNGSILEVSTCMMARDGQLASSPSTSKGDAFL
jgi:hypothetical protein